MDTLQTLVTTYGSSNSVAKILSSRDEGVYGWLTVNYLIKLRGNFPQKNLNILYMHPFLVKWD